MTIDLLIVGAGPAGLAAAHAARAHGLSVTCLDDQPSPGGQIWRNIETVAGTPRGTALGKSYLSGRSLAEAFRACGATYEADTQLWQLEPGFTAFVSRAGHAWTIRADAVLLATGAQERPVPFPGWTLPGVMTVGAAQVLLKSSGMVPDAPVFIAGCGPQPLLYAKQLLALGGRIAGYLDTAPPGQWRAALKRFRPNIASVPDLVDGLRWMAQLRLACVPVFRGVSGIDAEGEERLETLSFCTAGGAAQRLPASLVLVHEGVVPSLHAALSLGCHMSWVDDQDCYAPVLDEWGETSRPGVFVAGDAAGIGGAKAAVLRGRIAALGVAAKLGRAVETEAAPIRAALRQALALRPFLDAMFRPRREVFLPKDDVVVCRCEEITAGRIREVARLGRPGANQAKAFTRAGMGPCQGRQCGYTITRLLAEATGRLPGEIGFYRARPPLKPVTIGELATLDAGVRG